MLMSFMPQALPFFCSRPWPCTVLIVMSLKSLSLSETKRHAAKKQAILLLLSFGKQGHIINQVIWTTNEIF